jgi:hypothetical protein
MEPLLPNPNSTPFENNLHDMFGDHSNEKRLSVVLESSERDEHQEHLSLQGEQAKSMKLNWFKGWWIEIISFTFLVGFLITLNILLHFYDHKPVENTPKRPSLSTIVSIISTILAALVSFIAASGNQSFSTTTV